MYVLVSIPRTLLILSILAAAVSDHILVAPLGTATNSQTAGSPHVCWLRYSEHTGDQVP